MCVVSHLERIPQKKLRRLFPIETHHNPIAFVYSSVKILSLDGIEKQQQTE